MTVSHMAASKVKTETAVKTITHSSRSENNAVGSNEFFNYLSQLSEKESTKTLVKEPVLNQKETKVLNRTNTVLKEEKEMTSNELSEEEKNSIEELETKIKETLMNYLGMSFEELTQVMEQLNLTGKDMLDSTNLITLLGAVGYSTEAGDLLANSDLSALMKEFSLLTENTANQLGIKISELKQLLEQSQTVRNELLSQEKTQDSEMVSVEELALPEELENGKSVQTSNSNAMVLVTQTDQAVQADLPILLENEHLEEKTIQLGEDEQPNSGSLAEKESILLKEETDHSSSGQQNHSNEEEQQPNVNLQALQGKANQQISTSSIIVTQTPVDAKEIMSQIAEFSKGLVLLKDGTTSVQMQLNPENLGKIYIQITEHQGVIKATIAAQNELVREAIANQTSDLKQTLNQQGIKVEAVEILASTHEFEHNLENNKQQQSYNEQKEKEYQETKNLRRGELVELGDILTEEETLAAKIMQDNGNEVDFKA